MNDVPQIFDRRQHRLRIERALAGAPEPFLLERAAGDLEDRLGAVLRAFADVLDFGTLGPQARAVLSRRKGAGNITRLVEMPGLVESGVAGCIGDLEAPGLGEGAYDCIVSLLALHAVNDLPGVFAQIRRALRPDGMFIAAIMGGETLNELRSVLFDAEIETTGGASPRVSPFADVRALGHLLQRAGFALPVADSETVMVRYSSPLRLLQDLRAMGATNILADRSRRPLRRATLMRAMALYAARFSDPDGKVRATFEMVWLTGWAPHESQQKPLKPGSAKMRLADALKAAETSTGTKVGEE